MGDVIIGDDVQGGSFYASEKSFNEPIHPPIQAQLGPKRGMLKKGSTPVTAHESGPEAITQKSEMHGYEAEDIQWETVDGG